MKTYKKILVASTLMFASALPALVHAQDGNDDTWNGPYMGVTIGTSFIAGVVETANNNAVDEDLDGTGVSFGLMGGYNFSPFGRSETRGWLLGVEGDIQAINGDESKNIPYTW